VAESSALALLPVRAGGAVVRQSAAAELVESSRPVSALRRAVLDAIFLGGTADHDVADVHGRASGLFTGDHSGVDFYVAADRCNFYRHRPLDHSRPDHAGGDGGGDRTGGD